MVVSSRTTQFISFCFFKRAYRICWCGMRIDTWRTFGNNSMFFFLSSQSHDILVCRTEIWKLLWKTVSFGMGVFIVRRRPWGNITPNHSADDFYIFSARRRPKHFLEENVESTQVVASPMILSLGFHTIPHRKEYALPRTFVLYVRCETLAHVLITVSNFL